MRKNEQVLVTFQLLDAIRNAPGISAAALAIQVGLTSSGVRPYLASLEEAGQIVSKKAPCADVTGNTRTMQCFELKTDDYQHQLIQNLQNQVEELADWKVWALEVCPKLAVGKTTLDARKLLAKHCDTQEETHAILMGEHDDSAPMKAILELIG